MLEKLRASLGIKGILLEYVDVEERDEMVHPFLPYMPKQSSVKHFSLIDELFAKTVFGDSYQAAENFPEID
jgi:hypothetical protein